MVAKKFKSFAITIRPRDGVHDDLIKEFQIWFNKQEFIYAVTEKSGSERHLHFQTWCEEKYISDIKKQMKRICQRKITDWDKAQDRHCVYVKACYNDWYEDYLEDNPDKPEEVNELINKLPVNTLDYYPDEEEDERMKEENKATDKTFHQYTTRLTQYIKNNEIEEITKMTIAKFLHAEQHINKTMKVIREQKVARGLVQTLYTHFTQEFDATWYLPEVENNNKEIRKLIAQVVPPKSLNLT